MSPRGANAASPYGSLRIARWYPASISAAPAMSMPAIDVFISPSDGIATRFGPIRPSSSMSAATRAEGRDQGVR
ncbi:hypothetical protein LV28_09690 [Pandoraea pnomenusa]|nr:hypothetical protein LV28_09690 [Pandoraea pnomenusa]